MQSTVIMITNIAERLLRLFGNFPQRQPLKDDLLDCSSLRIVQRTQSFFDELPELLNWDMAYRLHARFPGRCLLKIGPSVELSQQKVVPPVNASVVRILQQPHFKSASGGVKSSSRSVNFEENALGDFLSFSNIAHDLERSHQDEPVVTIKQHGESIAVTALHFDHYLFI